MDRTILKTVHRVSDTSGTFPRLPIRRPVLRVEHEPVVVRSVRRTVTKHVQECSFADRPPEVERAEVMSLTPKETHVLVGQIRRVRRCPQGHRSTPLPVVPCAVVVEFPTGNGPPPNQCSKAGLRASSTSSSSSPDGRRWYAKPTASSSSES